jgi:hypothetical protein
MSPPAPVPDPTRMLMAPPRPLVTLPVFIVMNPLLPLRDAPEVSDSDPDEPAEVTAADDTAIAPVPPLVLPPLLTTTDPPVAEEDAVPDDNTMSPGEPELLAPTTTLTLPLRPAVADPL